MKKVLIRASLDAENQKISSKEDIIRVKDQDFSPYLSVMSLCGLLSLQVEKFGEERAAETLFCASPTQ